ncbi:helix-turn-helix transcriptional regulator [Pedobacter sp.]|jgi:transcriptional regulator with XRE-family HTH domain|uniref:helix-turn-helix domain-containing protein n=1 Tax=Pedobacter sp. TaxID=1411316 RepID=UPI002C279740|nr:helix-turn-helix transcriptional regulator [Pedobacter sp.]HWW41601.1 helix-turn-helix transcriptional regulator [Pedobacter sp.]
MKTVSKNIKLLRIKMGWRQHEVAALLEISVPAFSKIETGVTDININRLRQIADLFKVSIVDMFSSDATALKSEDTLKIEELSEKLRQRESLLIDLQMKLLQYYEEKSTVINIG